MNLSWLVFLVRYFFWETLIITYCNWFLADPISCSSQEKCVDCLSHMSGVRNPTGRDTSFFNRFDPVGAVWRVPASKETHWYLFTSFPPCARHRLRLGLSVFGENYYRNFSSHKNLEKYNMFCAEKVILSDKLIKNRKWEHFLWIIKSWERNYMTTVKFEINWILVKN